MNFMKHVSSHFKYVLMKASMQRCGPKEYKKICVLRDSCSNFALHVTIHSHVTFCFVSHVTSNSIWFKKKVALPSGATGKFAS